MPVAQPKVLFIHTYYPEFLKDLYAEDPTLADLDFDQQRERVLDTAFCLGDAYSHGLRHLGCEAADLIVNADTMQVRWASQHGIGLCNNIHDQRRQIIAAQLKHYHPDVLYVFEWCPLGDAFLSEIKSRVRLLVGQIASPLPDNRTFKAYDLMISSWPPIVGYFRREGISAEPLRLGFDERVLDRLDCRPTRYDVTFVGGFAPSHPDRIQWLERLLSNLDIDIFGYGAEQAAPGSAVRSHHRGHAWGRRMYEVLLSSKITINRHAHINVRGSVATNLANNMRLYEATGVGTCLVTENRENLSEIFEPDRELVAYDNESDCVHKIEHLLNNEPKRAAIAQAGQRRTLDSHTYAQRMATLMDILQKNLQ
jgi:hypothetical protein